MPIIRVKPDRRNLAAREQILDRLRSEFRDLPSLCLTSAQVQRLLGVREDICHRVLDSLVREGTICTDAIGRYVRCEPDIVPDTFGLEHV